MIGQNNLIKQIDTLIANNNYPKFSIIVGPAGSGKKLICKHIAESLNAFWCYEPDNKIETIRTVITDAYKVCSLTAYVFTDVDNMSIQAKNALLKITEEPPESAYFIMTVSDLNNVLDTIKSRATMFHTDSYSKSDIEEYVKLKKYGDSDLYCDLCTTPGEADKLYTMGAEEFYNYVEKVVDNIAYVSLANVFKIADKIALKPDADGYDLELFLRAFEKVCVSEMIKSKDNYDDFRYWNAGVKATTRILSLLQITGINKSALFDRFIIDVRKEWS